VPETQEPDVTKFDFEPLSRSAGNTAERRLLESARKDASPPGAREKMLASLGVPPASPERWLGRLFRRSGVSVPALNGIALGLLLSATIGGAVVSGSISTPGEPAAGRASSVAAITAPATTSEGARETEAEGMATVPVVTPGSLPSAPATPSVARPGKASTARTASTSLATATPTDALDKEIARIEAARVALERRRPAQTLRLLDAYDRDFPQGAFTIEVVVLRIEALAHAGRTEEARRLGSRFLAEHREGAFARRVDATLAATLAGTPKADEPPSTPSDD
jgi:hypothetical protein